MFVLKSLMYICSSCFLIPFRFRR